MMRNTVIFAGLIIVILLGAYWYGTAHHAVTITDNSSVQTVITQFGATIQKVSLSAPDVKDEIGAAYSPYVSADLLTQWQNNPPFAPGKGVSSPWPDRIQVDSLVMQPDGSYIAKGIVIEVTSNEVVHGGIAATYPVTMTLKKSGNQWLITSYDRGPETVGSTIGATSTTTAQ